MLNPYVAFLRLLRAIYRMQASDKLKLGICSSVLVAALLQVMYYSALRFQRNLSSESPKQSPNNEVGEDKSWMNTMIDCPANVC